VEERHLRAFHKHNVERYSFVAALETGRTSWTAVRLGPAEDATAVTDAELRKVVGGSSTAATGSPAIRAS
jgi:hypothetical protein